MQNTTLTQDWVVVSNIFYIHPYLGKIPILTNIFQMGWNHLNTRWAGFHKEHTNSTPLHHEMGFRQAREELDQTNRKSSNSSR